MLTIMPVFAPPPKIKQGELLQRLHRVNLSNFRVGVVLRMVQRPHTDLQQRQLYDNDGLPAR
jgi:hypothetical protein